MIAPTACPVYRSIPRIVRAPDDGDAARLIAAGAAALVTRYQLPQGRRYALLGPPTQVLPLTGSTHDAT